MSPKHILILGGFGSTGLPIAQFLLAETDVSIMLAGRNLEKANRAAAKLNTINGANRISSACVDAGDSQSLDKAFDGADMVAVASSAAERAERVARAALEMGIDYLDVQYSSTKLRGLQSLSNEIDQSVFHHRRRISSRNSRSNGAFCG